MNITVSEKILGIVRLLGFHSASAWDGRGWLTVSINENFNCVLRILEEAQLCELSISHHLVSENPYAVYAVLHRLAWLCRAHGCGFFPHPDSKGVILDIATCVPLINVSPDGILETLTRLRASYDDVVMTLNACVEPGEV